MSRFSCFFTGGVLSVMLLLDLGCFPLQASAADGLNALLDDAEQESAAMRAAIPSAPESRASLAELKDIFRTDYAAATTGAKKAALAARLFSHAEKTAKPVDRWVMYSEAVRLAADAGEATLTLEVISSVAREFDVDEVSLTLDALTKLAPKVSPQSVDDLAYKAFTLANKAVTVGSPETAQRALALALPLAKKSKNKDLLAEITGCHQSLKEQEQAAREMAAMESTLAAGKDDPDVCLKVGKYFCFEIDDWKRGLPLLAKGSDAELARLAVAETNSAKAPEARMAVADAWRTWAEGQKAALKTGGLRHAVAIYRSILPAMEGLDRVRVQKLIDDSTQVHASQSRRVALADLVPESVTDIFGGFSSDGSIGGVPFIHHNHRCPKALSGHITALAATPSSIRYRIPAGAKRLVGKAAIVTPISELGKDSHPAAPQVFEILLDGRSVWKSAPLSKRDDAAEFGIPLRNAKTLELQVRSTSHVCAWTAWLSPEFLH